MKTNIIIITGHYGCGKTNLALNMAYSLSKEVTKVTLADLDVVNPYFRSSDLKVFMENKGVHVLASDYAGSTLDIPSVNGGLSAAINGATKDNKLIIDVGGDDAGALALGRFSRIAKNKGYKMIYVINKNRLLTSKPNESFEILKEIETVSRMKADYIVNNTHLSKLTTADDVVNSAFYAKKVSQLCEIPVLFTSIRRDLYEKLDNKEGFYPVDIFVKTPWD